MASMVALDIETTGLDPRSDAIIEIGAVRFNGRRIENEWSTLINPNRPIPPAITQLTGIKNEMVRNAPSIQSVLHTLQDFVGDSPVLGHNVAFDLGFLRRQRILQDNEAIDSYDLAAIILPTATRYNLGSIGQILGILIPNSHRALDDARLAHAVYSRLVEMAMDLPIDLIAEIVRMSEGIEWNGAYAFQSILRERARQPIAARKVSGETAEKIFKNPVELYPPLIPNQTIEPLDVEEVSSILEHGGSFSRFFEHFEQRPEQVEMLRRVTTSLSNSQHTMVEAGTGIGKSFAYLIPSALFAIKNNTRVIISTNTITLQDQLIKKDIPDLKSALDLDLRATVLKGRSNYLCPHRLDSMRHRGPETAEEIRVLAKVLVWLHQGGGGDRSEINLNGPYERDVWMRLSAEDEGCTTESCLARTGGACPFFRARQSAQSAHLIVVNHALLLSDVITGSRVLPEYNYLIVDEAHHLESATTNALTYRATQYDLSHMLHELGSVSAGIMSRLLSAVRKIAKPSEEAAIHAGIQKATDLAFRLDNSLTGFFRALDHFLGEQRDGLPVGSYGQQMRIIPATRTLPNWTAVEIAWDDVHEVFKAFLPAVSDIHNACGDLAVNLGEDLEDTLGNLGSVHRRLSEACTNLNAIVAAPDANMIYWVELQPNNGKLVLQMAPIQIGSMMEQHLWHEKASIVLTSATLTTNNGFDYLRNRLNADEADELILGSPFDYENSTLLYILNDIAEPGDMNNYQRQVDQTLVQLAKATGGRMLTLFTSYAQLKRTSQNISPPLNEAEINVYEQGEGASTNILLETFRESDRAVLLGTRAFWEGVDIPGAALSVLAIVKLPFDVPSDPIIAARSETFDDPFNEYSLPEAILRFRQGFGRLIRTQSDRGVVVIMDKRVLTKQYGKKFIESLPACHLEVGSMLELPRKSTRWLNL